MLLLGKARSAFKQVKRLNVILIAQQSLCSSTFDLRSTTQPFYATQKSQRAVSTANAVALIYI